MLDTRYETRNRGIFARFCGLGRGEYTMRVCIGEGRERVACSLLYPIFKFGNFLERIPRESVCFLVGLRPFPESVFVSVVIFVDEFGCCKFGYSIHFWYISTHFHCMHLSQNIAIEAPCERLRFGFSDVVGFVPSVARTIFSVYFENERVVFLPFAS